MLPGIRMASLGYAQLTGLTTAKGFASVPAGANAVLIVASGQPVRWRDDGTAPTASAGMHLAVDTEFLYTGNLSAIEFIEESASATVDVTFYKMVG